MHPGISITEDQHFATSGNPGISGLGWNGSGKGNGMGNWGSWALAETTTQTNTIKKKTYLIDIMRRGKKKKKDFSKYMSLYRVCVLIDEQIVQSFDYLYWMERRLRNIFGLLY